MPYIRQQKNRRFACIFFLFPEVILASKCTLSKNFSYVFSLLKMSTEAYSDLEVLCHDHQANEVSARA